MWTSARMIILSSANNNEENIYTNMHHIRISREINELLQ